MSDLTEYEEAFADWLTQTVTVERFEGPGPKGPVYAAPVQVGPTADAPGVMVKWGNRLVRGSDGEERVSDATLTMGLRHAAAFATEGRVTLPDGQVRSILARSVDAPDLPLAHVRVSLS